MKLLAGACVALLLSSSLAFAGERKCMRDMTWLSAPMWKPIDRKAFWAPMRERMVAWDAEWNKRWKRM